MELLPVTKDMVKSEDKEQVNQCRQAVSNSRKWLIIGEKCGKKHILCDFSSLPPYCQGLSVGCVARLLLVGLSALKSVPFSGLSCFMVDETEPFVSFAFLILAK